MPQEHKVLFLDFETYYAQDYSLSMMDPPSYILDPRFENIGCAVKEAGQPESKWIDGPDFGDWLKQYDPAHTTTVTFNALFDNCILSWRYGFVPVRMFCAMRMAASLRGHLLSSISLASCSRFFHLPPKGTTIGSVKGMRRADIMAIPTLWQEYQDYSCRDNDNCESIFNILLPEFPYAERRIMDRVLRCAVQPRFNVDVDMLREHLKDLEKAKVQLLVDAGCDLDPDLLDKSTVEQKIEAFAKTLRSNTKFEKILRDRGIEIEYKPSATDPTRMIPAFAKTDGFMEMLQNHEDPEIEALACARLGLRSTIEQTRGTRFLNIATLPWKITAAVTGTMPMPLKYAAAHTQRLGGDWSLNVQNLPSSRQKLSKLRKSLVAPPGHKVVVADLAQIECRINAWLCGQGDLLDIFRAKGDPYSVLGSSIFDTPVDKTTGGGIYRFIGKSGVLGLGFRCAGPKFYNMVVRSARTLGMDVKKLLTVWTPDLADKSVRSYRYMNSQIVQTWYRLDDVLDTAWMGTSGPQRFGPGGVVEIGHGYVMGPGGLRMNYANPRTDEDGERRYDYGNRSHKMHGGVFLENIVQFLARIVVMNAALRIGNRTGLHFCLQAHDELAWIVPDAAVEVFEKIAYMEMKRPPSWALDIPLDAEIGHGQSYGDAK